MDCRDEPTNKIYKGVSQGILNDLRLYAQYSTAAYCPGNNDSPGNRITCPNGDCPEVEAVNAKTMIEFQNTRLADDTGFLAVDHVHRVIVLAFRGSSSTANWNTDFNIRKAPVPWCDECKAHTGFWLAWNEIRDMVLAKIAVAMKAHRDYDLVLTGHSLGGAIATLAAGDIRRQMRARLVSFLDV